VTHLNFFPAYDEDIHFPMSVSQTIPHGNIKPIRHTDPTGVYSPLKDSLSRHVSKRDLPFIYQVLTQLQFFALKYLLVIYFNNHENIEVNKIREQVDYRVII